MSENPIKSKAFRRAALKSESYRVTGLLFLLGGFAIFVIVRGIALNDLRLLLAQSIVLSLVITHEIFMLRAVKRALDNDSEVAPERWVLNVFIESQIPTVALFLLMAGPWLTAFQVLVAPAVLIYFLIIILSTLRLSPNLTLLTGMLSSFGYLFLVFFIETTVNNPDARMHAFPLAFYFIYALLILTAAIVGAFVANQIRNHVSAALREAELQSELERVNNNLEIARSIQQGLLPSRAPELEEFEISGWNQPADETGGDYFDWQALPDGRVAISLADATGHGIGPALVSASCRAYSRASLLAGADKNGLLDRLNLLLAEDLSANRFVTFAVAFLDPSNAGVKVMSAGHGPILLYKTRTDQIENVEAHGIPLGMIAGVPYSHGTESRLEPGDMLILITDGFYEWENPEGEQFGLERLEKTIREAQNCSAEEVIEKLRDSVKSFCRGTAQQDDLTAVVLKRKLL
jgi:serine phosphatase RsbU (regulator of sigma subunit)